MCHAMRSLAHVQQQQLRGRSLPPDLRGLSSFAWTRLAVQVPVRDPMAASMLRRIYAARPPHAPVSAPDRL